MKFAAAMIVGISMMGVASAAPFATPDASAPVGHAYVYTTKAKGASGTDVSFDIPSPPNGLYMASFVADFANQGSKTSPAMFACWIEKNGHNNVGQSTSIDTGLFFAAVSAQTFVQVVHGTKLAAHCGVASGGGWNWGNVPLQVTFVKIAGETSGALGAPVESDIATRAQSGTGGGSKH